KHKSISGVEWRELVPDTNNIWRAPVNAGEFAVFVPVGTREAKAACDSKAVSVFMLYGRGVATCRDEVVYDFDRLSLQKRVKAFIEDYNAEVDRYKRVRDKQPV